MNTTPADVQADTPLLRGTFALVDLCSGRTHPLRPGPNGLGRSSGSAIVLDHHTVSRHHCVVMVHDTGACEVGDAKSRNGVLVNGHRVSGVSPLEPGDVLRICNFSLLLTRSAAGAEPERIVFTDETLGTVVRDTAHGCWHFTVVFGPDCAVGATYYPADQGPPEPGADWDGVRACYRWLRTGVPAARALVQNRRGSPKPARLPELELTHVTFTNASATLVFNEDDDAVCVTVDPQGRLTSGPVRIERGSDEGE